MTQPCNGSPFWQYNFQVVGFKPWGTSLCFGLHVFELLGILSSSPFNLILQQLGPPAAAYFCTHSSLSESWHHEVQDFFLNVLRHDCNQAIVSGSRVSFQCIWTFVHIPWLQQWAASKQCLDMEELGWVTEWNRGDKRTGGGCSWVGCIITYLYYIYLSYICPCLEKPLER